MLTAAQNELLVRTGPGTPAGNLLRRYWQPVALSEDVSAGGPPRPLTVLGEELVLFRQESGALGLLALRCSHRGADLSYGRIEDGGLRCLYHGWLYDAQGRCLEQPNELPGNSYAAKIRHPAYPCQDLGDMIFAYLGPGAPPVLPRFEALLVPDSHRLVQRSIEECNYLQGVEGDLDPSHVSFLHRAMPGLVAELDQDRKAGDLKPWAEFRHTGVEAEETEFGVRIFAVRPAADQRLFVRVSNFVMPNLDVTCVDNDGQLLLWHVPIDDNTHLKFMVPFSRSAPISQDQRDLYRAETRADGTRVRNRANRYLQDRASMNVTWFAGMGPYFGVHDSFATESQGVIADRTREHLGPADAGLIAMRRKLTAAIDDVKKGTPPPNLIDDPAKARVRIPTATVMLDGRGDWRAAAHDAAAEATPAL